jgi:hypothetical protein
MPGEPVCTVIVFCDYIITEANSGKNSLIGTFPNLASPTFPFLVQQFFVHASISNFVPTGQPINLAINLKQQTSGSVVGSVGMPIMIPILKNQPQAPSGGQIALNIPFKNVTFPAPGSYLCEVLFNGDEIGRRMLDLVQIPQRQMPFSPQSNPPMIPPQR